MKKYLISGFNTVQDVKLEAGTYTLVAYAKSMYSNVYTFALGDGENWTEYDIDVVQGQLCKVWLTFTIDKKATKFKPIANNFSESLPVYVTDLQLTKGNIPVEAGASPFDIDQILNDLHDGIDAIEDFAEGAFLDGLLSREEKTQLRASLDSIGAIVESVKGSYNKLLDNPFIHENTMDNITARYYAFIASWISDGDPRGLKPVILWIVNGDNIVSQNEREEKDRALNAFNDALYAYNQAEKEVYSDVGENSIAPIITDDGFWAFWSTELQEFIPSEFSAEGDDGHSPYIDVLTGTWWEWSPELGKYKDTLIKAEGEDGQDAIAPIIIDGFWAFWDKETETFIPSEFSAIGDDGHAPIIRDGYWYEWNPESTEEDKYENTGVRAEGVKGDGVQQKFLSSDEKPTRPTGDAIGWSDIPDEEEAPDVPLEPIGDNLYDKQYLLNTGWLPDGTANVYRLDNVGYVDMFPPTVFKSNTQYKYTFGASSSPDWRPITIQYSDNSTEDRTLKENFNTAKNKTVVSIKIHAGLNVYISNTTKLYELGRPTVQAKPIWTIFRNITDGVASEWSEPVKWLGEGTPGRDGQDAIAPTITEDGFWAFWDKELQEFVPSEFSAVGDDGHSPYVDTTTGTWWEWNPTSTPPAYRDTGIKAEGKDGTGVSIKSSVDTWNDLNALTGNEEGDARIVEDTGHLAVWDGSKWVDAGEFKGDPGKTSYFHQKWSDDGGATFTANNGETPGDWMGSYVDFIEADSLFVDDYKWVYVKGDKGDKGEKGEKGEKGDGVRILGSFNTPSELSGVSNPTLGDGYMINGDLWVYVGGSIHTPPAPVGWNNVGRIKGDKGKDGSSYLVLGYWSPDYEYQISDAGIPVVKMHGSSGFIAYKLIVPKSTPGQFINTDPNKEWELVDSSEFTYMLEAYIEVLQAELITAEKIVALDIVHPSGKYSLIDGKLKVKDAQVSGQYINPYNTTLLTVGGIDEYLDVSKYSSFYVPTTPNGSNNGWYETILPHEQKYNGLTLNFIWKVNYHGAHWRIKSNSGVIHSDYSETYNLDFTSDTDRFISLTAFWNTVSKKLEWVVISNQKLGVKKEDRIRMGEIFLTGDVNSNGNLLSSSSKFGFTATSQKVEGGDGEYLVSLSKSPNNPLNSMNYMPVITPIAWTTPVFTGSQLPSKTSFSVYVRSRDGGLDVRFRFALIAMQDLDLRDQFGL